MSQSRVQRSFYAFTRTAKKEFGISHLEAIRLWREMEDRLERKPFAVDIKRHPRITLQELRDALKPKAIPPEVVKLPTPKISQPRDLDFLDIVLEIDLEEFDSP